MPRYIDADELKERLQKCKSTSNEIFGMGITRGVERAETTIDMTPTADVVEVKHGEWYLLDECANAGVYCSICHKKVYKTEYANQKLKSNYCPNCGAKMDGGKDE